MVKATDNSTLANISGLAKRLRREGRRLAKHGDDAFAFDLSAASSYLARYAQVLADEQSAARKQPAGSKPSRATE
jgi:hypothetical protein